MLILHLLLALALPAFAVEAPFPIRELKDERDAAAINEGFRAFSTNIRKLQAQVDALPTQTSGYAIPSDTQTFSGVNTYTSSNTVGPTVYTTTATTNPELRNAGSGSGHFRAHAAASSAFPYPSSSDRRGL